jgi:cell division protein FtsZ
MKNSNGVNKKHMEVKPKIESFARIKVLGIGGSGTSAVNRMSELGIKGVEFVAINTDSQALHNNQSDKKVHIGKKRVNYDKKRG